MKLDEDNFLPDQCMLVFSNCHPCLMFKKKHVVIRIFSFFDIMIRTHPNEGDTKPVFEDSKNSRSIK